jgi:hypothetical protein
VLTLVLLGRNPGLLGVLARSAAQSEAHVVVGVVRRPDPHGGVALRRAAGIPVLRQAIRHVAVLPAGPALVDGIAPLPLAIGSLAGPFLAGTLSAFPR